MENPQDTMTIDELISWAEDKARQSSMENLLQDQATSLSSIAYSLVAIAKLMRERDT